MFVRVPVLILAVWEKRCGKLNPSAHDHSVVLPPVGQESGVFKKLLKGSQKNEGRLCSHGGKPNETIWRVILNDSFLAISPPMLSEIALLYCRLIYFLSRLFICKSMAHFKKELSVIASQHFHSLIQRHHIVSALQARCWLFPQPWVFREALNSPTSAVLGGYKTNR